MAIRDFHLFLHFSHILRNSTPLLRPKVRSFSGTPTRNRGASSRSRASPADILDSCSEVSIESKSFPTTSRSEADECSSLLISFGLSQDSSFSVLNSCPGVRLLGFLKKWEVGFSRFGFCTSSPVLVQRVLEHSSRFDLEPDRLLCYLKELRQLGLENETLTRVLEELPGVPLNSLLLDVISKIKLLETFGFRKAEIDKICRLFPGFLFFSTDGRLRPLFAEFVELDFDKEELRRMTVWNPRLLLGMEVGELSRCVQLLRSLKCRLPLKERIMNKGILHAAIDVKQRVDCLCKHGLIRREALKVLWVEPRTITYRLIDIEKKIEFLLHKMGFCIDCLVDVPEYMGVNFEKQIVPRYRVIECLRSKDALGLEVGLRQLIKPSRKKFYNMFVKPYPDCERIFGGLVRKEEIKTQHPSGLWKLFKPVQHTKSVDDIGNMKLFMESLV